MNTRHPGIGDCDLICLSLEPWDQVWRRNQFMVVELLRARSWARVLFVEPPLDVTWSVRHGKKFTFGGTRPVGDTGRLWAFTPRKWLPRRLASGVDHLLGRQVLAASRGLGFVRPSLWVNDSTYADLLSATGWASIYDVTDDWLLASYPPREMARQRRNDAVMLRDATEVVVCSPALERSRGLLRPVHLVANGVDVDHFRRPQPRPDDLPSGQALVYTGTLADARIDVDLTVGLSEAVAGQATVVLIGPNSCSADATERLTRAGVTILGPRPYAGLPAYLQHAAVLVVPHVVSPFTESLDPIKAREILAVGRPTVTTPVAGMRDLGPPVVVATAETFVAQTLALLAAESIATSARVASHDIPTWTQRAADFMSVLDRARGVHPDQNTDTVPPGPAGPVPAPAITPNAAGQPPLEVVIVAYGAPAHLARALAGLGGTYPVVVVDNSSDPANRTVATSAGARYIDPGTNLGFGAGVNHALAQRSHGADLLLLNPDAFVEPPDVERLRSALRASADLAAVAPAQRSADGSPPDRVEWPFPSPARAWQEAFGLARLGPQRGFLIGSVLMLRAEALADVGGFDERFFLYAEETDWQQRAIRRGWRVGFCAEAAAIHLGAATDPDTDRRELRFHVGTERYVRKWYRTAGWQSFRAAAVLGAVLRAVVRSGQARTVAANRARIFLVGPDRLARRAEIVPTPGTHTPRVRGSE